MSEVEILGLIDKVITDEVKRVVFVMHPDKASCPDGLNPTFFQYFWGIVQNDVVAFCRQFM